MTMRFPTHRFYATGCKDSLEWVVTNNKNYVIAQYNNPIVTISVAINYSLLEKSVFYVCVDIQGARLNICTVAQGEIVEKHPNFEQYV